jgi:UDP-N-acetylmuramoyl-L-alanyl-D-glutamate--2,6-diaminopimelate ligase
MEHHGMTLEEILAGVRRTAGLSAEVAAASVTGLDYDSRRVDKDFLFFAFPGKHADGRSFASEAFSKGALAVVSELPPPVDFDRPWVQVAHGRQALAIAARNFYRAPDTRLGLTGITGTNGKTTTAFLVDAILRAAGRTTAMVGTIEYHVAGKILMARNTTPESLDLFRMFVDLEQAGGTYATLEASSHALALGRLYGIHFHTAAFTNLTRDHLDFHHTMEEYFAAKCELFQGQAVPPPLHAVINHDDAYGCRIPVPSGTRAYFYGIEAGAGIRAVDITAGFEGLRFTLQAGDQTFPIVSPLTGRMNVYNILAACSVGLSYGLDADTIARGIATCRQIPGRFERIDEGQPFLVVVDYAHTDDALRNVIGVARGLHPRRVLTLFGCGGDRDRAKRPMMGEAAGSLSDFVVLTSDNPRSEDPLAIMTDALVGLGRYDVAHVAEPDRRKAIHRVLEEARPGDIVILAGKGHETYQVLHDGPIPFDDRVVAGEILQGMGYSRKTS